MKMHKNAISWSGMSRIIFSVPNRAIALSHKEFQGESVQKYIVYCFDIN